MFNQEWLDEIIKEKVNKRQTKKAEKSKRDDQRKKGNVSVTFIYIQQIVIIHFYKYFEFICMLLV